jgi:hypothetical protein
MSLLLLPLVHLSTIWPKTKDKAVSLAAVPLCPSPSPQVCVKWSGYALITSAILVDDTSGMYACWQAKAISRSLSSSHKQTVWVGNSVFVLVSGGHIFSAKYWQLIQVRVLVRAVTNRWITIYNHTSGTYQFFLPLVAG